MSEETESPLADLDPEIERTFRERRKIAEAAKRQSKMGEKRSLRELWIPQNHSAATDMAPPAIQANNFELKPALISMVQHKQFGGSPLEDPHEI